MEVRAWALQLTAESPDIDSKGPQTSGLTRLGLGVFSCKMQIVILFSLGVKGPYNLVPNRDTFETKVRGGAINNYVR